MPDETQTLGSEQQSDVSQKSAFGSRDSETSEGHGQNAPSSEGGYSGGGGSAAGTAPAQDNNNSGAGNSPSSNDAGQSQASPPGAAQGQSNEPGLASASAWRPGEEAADGQSTGTSGSGVNSSSGIHTETQAPGDTGGGAQGNRGTDIVDSDVLSERGDSGGGSSF